MTLPLVVWRPTTKFGYPYKGNTGRSLPVLAIVYHRIVGDLASADAVFAPTSDRTASSTFAIGHIGGRLEIHQYVDMSDAQWCNGDAYGATAKVVLDHPGVNPNIYTVSIEHEDGGYAGRGVVPADVWAASIALTRLITSGDAKAIRAAGIRVRYDLTVAQLAAVPLDATGLIDHHQISGSRKPYCFRRWLDDLGFVEGTPSRRDQLIAGLRVLPDTAKENDMPRITQWQPGVATLDADAQIRTAPTLADETKWFLTQGKVEVRTFVGWVEGDAHNGSTRWGCYFIPGAGKWAYTHQVNVLDVAAVDTAALEKAAADATAAMRDAQAAAAATDQKLKAAKPHIDAAVTAAATVTKEAKAAQASLA